MRVLITGGAGFVGSRLGISFRREGHEVVAFDNLRRRGAELNRLRLPQLGIEFVHGDIRVPSDLDALPGEFDLCIECSAEPSVLSGIAGSPDYVLDTNLVGTIHALNFVRKRARKFVFLSTSRVYSIQPLAELPLIEEKTRFNLDTARLPEGVSSQGIGENFSVHLPRSLYGATKLCSEYLIQEFVHLYGLKAHINRCGVISGSGQFGKIDQGVVALWMASHFFGSPLSYIGYGGLGKQVRDVLHPDDLFDLIQLQIKDENMDKGEVLNIGGGLGNSISLFELTSLCEEISGKQINITKVEKTNPVDIPYFVTDNSKVQKILGWSPKRTVRMVLEEIHSWLCENSSDLRSLFTR